MIMDLSYQEIKKVNIKEMNLIYVLEEKIQKKKYH